MYPENGHKKTPRLLVALGFLGGTGFPYAARYCLYALPVVSKSAAG